MSPDQNVSFFDDPVLFRAWGIDWDVSTFCVATGVGLWLLAGVFGWILARNTEGAKWQVMSSAEAADLAVNAGRAPHERVGQVYAAKAVGVSGEIHASIDDLRQAARRGDWLTFWLWPILFSCVFGGAGFFFSGLTLSAPRVIWVLVILFSLLTVGVSWFMAWAAIYTNIDAGTAQKSSSGESRTGR